MIKIDDKTSCSGCSACANICPQKCISMKKDNMGFVYPLVDTIKCVDCGLCERICPCLKDHENAKHTQLTVYAAQFLDDTVRSVSSSGGIFTCLARYILLQKGVVFGATFDDEFRIVRHISVRTVKELYRIQGSKYIQSYMGSSYSEVKDLLENGTPVLFSGTLCQIEGLKAFLHKDYQNLYLVDVVCYGVPAPGVWSAYIDSLEKKYKGKAVGVSFRDKRNGWSDYVISVKFSNGKEYVNSRSNDLYMRGFLHDYYLRPSCYQCNYKSFKKITDITLGDLWGIEHLAPELNDEKGTSLVIISSEKGKSLFEKAASNMVKQVVRIEDAVKYNPAIEYNCHSNRNWVQFERDFGNKPILVLLKQYCSESILKKILRRIKREIKK